MNSRASNDMNDEDIARVFDAHSVDVPAALDDKILKAARHSGAIPTNTEVTPSYPRKNWLVPGFAIAATVMLTVAIAPLLFQSPDAERLSNPDDSNIAAMAPSAVDAVASPAVDVATSNETMQSRTAAISEEAQAIEGADTNSPVTSNIVVAEASNETSAVRSKEAIAETGATANARISVASAARKKSAQAPGTQAPEAVVQQSISGGSASADAAQLLTSDENLGRIISGLTAANRSPSYDPDKPDSWLDTIKRLAIEDKPELARDEFDKFRARYPDYQVDFRLDEFLQTLETPEQATD